jgi:arylsulfatase A-like enzyme
MSRRPNFLFLITDQQRADHTGFGGNPVLRTPNLDALAARSLQFDRALVANPICMPNRASIFTGRLPSVHGTRINGIALDPASNTFPRVLRGEGYRTAYFGKLHLQNLGDGQRIREVVWKDAPEHDAWQPPYEPGWDDWELQARHEQEYVRIPPDFYGLDHVDLAINHADLCGGHYYQWLLEQGVEPAKLAGRKNALPFDASWRQIWRTRVPEELYPTHYVTMRTCEFLEQRTSQPDQPFLAFCSYPDPHHPFTPPGRYFDMYDPDSIPLPASFDDPHNDSMAHYRARRAQRGEQVGRMAPFSPTERQFRQMAAAEYGMISMIDDGIGEVLATLARTGLADDTVVVFTSDHGDMFGDHGMMLKAGMHYEGCTRVPLLIAVPGKQPGVSNSLVSSLDLAQTVLELTDEPEYQGMQGTSLAPLLDDPARRVREHVLVEEDEMFDLAGVGSMLRMRTLIAEEARLTIYRGSAEGELFDLERDPSEMSNLYDKAAGRALRAEMAERTRARSPPIWPELSPEPWPEARLPEEIQR